MVDEELKELLSDYRSMAESERSGFAAEVVKNLNFANVVFNSLLAFEQDRTKNTDILSPLCDLLYNIYRRDGEGKIFSLQFLPQLAFVYLLNYGDKQQFGCIETLLIGIHNIEAKDTTSFRIPNLAQNSIYHEAYQISESSRIFIPESANLNTNSSTINNSGGITDTSRLGGGGNFGGNNMLTVRKVPPPQVQVLNCQNKQSVLAFLFNVYCSVLIDMSRHSVDFTCKLASRMVTRGFNIGSKKSHRRNVSYGSDQGSKLTRLLPNRLVLSSAILLELLHLGYFALMNQVPNPGLALIRDIEFRAKHASMDSVLLVSKALLKMAPNGPYLEEQRYISTPSQLSKNLITNASFRAKKLEGDIPRIPGDGEMEGGLVQGGGAGSGGMILMTTGTGGQQILMDPKMGVIAEEEDGIQGEGGRRLKEAKDGVENIADKIKARMDKIPNAMRKKLDRNSESEGNHEREGGKFSRNSDKKDKKKDKKEGKHSSSHLTVNDNDQGMLLAPPSAADEMKLGGLNLGGGGAAESETITIHSPESGTTSIF